MSRVRHLALPAIGLITVLSAVFAGPEQAVPAMQQVWPPFILILGLLLLARAAEKDGLFAVASALLARTGRRPIAQVAVSAALVSVVTAVFNLDTAVLFLTPILVLAGRQGGDTEPLLLYLSVFLANAASLLLPGSNLTNLILLGPDRVSGFDLVAHMALPWLSAIAVTTVVVSLILRRHLRAHPQPQPSPRPSFRVGAGVLGTALAVIAMVVLRPSLMAPLVLLLGLTVVTIQRGSIGSTLRVMADSVDLVVLGSLFLLAVSLGTFGRAWSQPNLWLNHLGPWATAGIGAASAVTLNNLPATSFLAAHPSPNPFALLIGLNLGPNLAVTGSLSAVLWSRAARNVGATPSAWRYSAIGIVVVPLSMVAAMGALALVS